MSNKVIYINRTIDELLIDIKHTEEPIKKTILQRFLDIKIKEQETNNNIRVMNKKNTDDKINKIIRTQISSLNMLERINNIKTKASA